jgi:hypothetical protein
VKFSVLIPSYGEKERLFNLLKTIIQDEQLNLFQALISATNLKFLKLSKDLKILLSK